MALKVLDQPDTRREPGEHLSVYRADPREQRRVVKFERGNSHSVQLGQSARGTSQVWADSGDLAYQPLVLWGIELANVGDLRFEYFQVAPDSRQVWHRIS